MLRIKLLLRQTNFNFLVCKLLKPVKNFNMFTNWVEILLPKARELLLRPRLRILCIFSDVYVIYRPEVAKIILVCNIHTSDEIVLIFWKQSGFNLTNIVTKFEGKSFYS